jgi:hypothetical protein
MEIFMNPIGSLPGQPAKALHGTLYAPVNELMALRDAIDLALHGAPTVVETQSQAGIPIRLIVDRQGPAIPKQ